jgi:hypothetical protein
VAAFVALMTAYSGSAIASATAPNTVTGPEQVCDLLTASEVQDVLHGPKINLRKHYLAPPRCSYSTVDPYADEDASDDDEIRTEPWATVAVVLNALKNPDARRREVQRAVRKRSIPNAETVKHLGDDAIYAPPSSSNGRVTNSGGFKVLVGNFELTLTGDILELNDESSAIPRDSLFALARTAVTRLA